MKLTTSGLVTHLISVMVFPPFCLMKCLHEVNPPVTSKQWMETIPSLALEDTFSSEANGQMVLGLNEEVSLK